MNSWTCKREAPWPEPKQDHHGSTPCPHPWESFRRARREPRVGSPFSGGGGRCRAQGSPVPQMLEFPPGLCSTKAPGAACRSPRVSGEGVRVGPAFHEHQAHSDKCFLVLSGLHQDPQLLKQVVPKPGLAVWAPLLTSAHCPQPISPAVCSRSLSSRPPSCSCSHWCFLVQLQPPAQGPHYSRQSVAASGFSHQQGWRETLLRSCLLMIKLQWAGKTQDRLRAADWWQRTSLLSAESRRPAPQAVCSCGFPWD